MRLAYAGRAWAAPVLALFAAVAGISASAETRILVYGDSNSWGWIPSASGFPTTRYGDATRWPGVMAAELARLGRPATVMVDALSGRTIDTPYPDALFGLPGQEFDGLAHLSAAVASELPLDLVVIMLGTNDARADLAVTPEAAAEGISRMVSAVRNINGGVGTSYPAPQVLVVAPPAIGDTSGTPIGAVMQGASARSAAISAAILHAGEAQGFAVMDGGATVKVTSLDGVHLTPEMHLALGRAVAARATALLGP